MKTEYQPRTGDRVTVAPHVRTPINGRYGEQILRDTVLEVQAVGGNGSRRFPWTARVQIIAREGQVGWSTVWTFEASDLVLVEAAQ